MKNNVILIGFMGCGKTSVGIKLSYAMKRTVIDTDKWIEQKQAASITEIFATRGEAAFREMETDCLKALLSEKGGHIIATGGGLPVREANHELLKQLGRVYYLRVTPETVYERLKGDNTRPLLAGDEAGERIRSLMAARAAAYEQCADVIIDTDKAEIEDIAAQIHSREKAFLRERKNRGHENTGN